jgi:N-acetylglucosamine kinase-like BadF-type ATPase
MDVVLGVDVGGTKSRAVLLGPDLAVVAMDEVPTATSERVRSMRTWFAN